MAEVSQVSATPKSFTTIKYTTKDGENISATKNNGIVTLVGDKNDVRQMPVKDFMEELKTNLANVQLEKAPEKDTVELSKSKAPAEAAKPEAKAEAKKADDKKVEDKKAPADDKKAVDTDKNAAAKTEAKTAPEKGKKLDVAA